MKRVGAIAGIAVGMLFGLFGLLFLVGYGGHLYRLAIAAVGLALGGLCAGLGVLLWKTAQAQSPEQVRKDILALAARRAGSITEADLVAAMPDRAERAVQALQEMARAGICVSRWVAGATRFEFVQLQPTVVFRKCGHCGWEAPLSSQVSACPTCGGPIIATRGSDSEAIGLDG